MLSPPPDKTLTQEGVPADAKAVGDALDGLKLKTKQVTATTNEYGMVAAADVGLNANNVFCVGAKLISTSVWMSAVILPFMTSDTKKYSFTILDSYAMTPYKNATVTLKVFYYEI